MGINLFNFEPEPLRVLVSEHIVGGNPDPLASKFFGKDASDRICPSVWAIIPGTDAIRDQFKFKPDEVLRARCEKCDAPFDVQIGYD